jgi:hypothetical protein
MSIMCPICGYPDIREPSLKWSICPSCGTQFGLTDRGRTHDEIRAMWIAGGARWHSSVVTRPPNWSPLQQLANINYKPTSEDVRAMVSRTEVASVALKPSSVVRVRYVAVGISQSPGSYILMWNTGARLMPLTHPTEPVPGSFTKQTA